MILVKWLSRFRHTKTSVDKQSASPRSYRWLISPKVEAAILNKALANNRYPFNYRIPDDIVRAVMQNANPTIFSLSTSALEHAILAKEWFLDYLRVGFLRPQSIVEELAYLVHVLELAPATGKNYLPEEIIENLEAIPISPDHREKILSWEMSKRVPSINNGKWRRTSAAGTIWRILRQIYVVEAGEERHPPPRYGGGLGFEPFAYPRRRVRLRNLFRRLELQPLRQQMSQAEIDRIGLGQEVVRDSHFLLDEFRVVVGLPTLHNDLPRLLQLEYLSDTREPKEYLSRTPPPPALRPLK